MFATMKLWGISRVCDHRILKRIRHSVIVYVHFFQSQCIRLVFFFEKIYHSNQKKCWWTSTQYDWFCASYVWPDFLQKVPLMCVRGSSSRNELLCFAWSIWCSYQCSHIAWTQAQDLCFTVLSSFFATFCYFGLLLRSISQLAMPTYEVSHSARRCRTPYIVMLTFISLRHMANAFVVPSSRNHLRSTFRLFSAAATETDKSNTKTGYPFAEVESKWQAYWEENETFKTPERDTSKPKKICFGHVPIPFRRWTTRWSSRRLYR